MQVTFASTHRNASLLSCVVVLIGGFISRIFKDIFRDTPLGRMSEILRPRAQDESAVVIEISKLFISLMVCKYDVWYIYYCDVFGRGEDTRKGPLQVPRVVPHTVSKKLLSYV